MAPKKERAPIGIDPIDAGTALGIESKAVFKDTYYFSFERSRNCKIQLMERGNDQLPITILQFFPGIVEPSNTVKL
ncbi:hypothetical protein [Cyclobacterium marinum]|uniref:Uncharacterized protein n=1 Tax=Cyclobacterium marinum (strain ATCC 25205 / DSM 745 / LMG 13164 / NCIMB 1802) TaxID=880070 RepID=G0J637_CYCMS|nr:hypothetical protein [Cyclobacterium marinum]AEL26100.1 hypothetical protein Cycma_2358 [Cyclobacterium marinum DSM 745]|tara:strand:+ start:1353 stop:1580 length:228 start_codon:yes stop_codon:yes gene_type:complete